MFWLILRTTCYINTLWFINDSFLHFPPFSSGFVIDLVIIDLSIHWYYEHCWRWFYFIVTCVFFIYYTVHALHIHFWICVSLFAILTKPDHFFLCHIPMYLCRNNFYYTFFDYASVPLSAPCLCNIVSGIVGQIIIIIA